MQSLLARRGGGLPSVASVTHAPLRRGATPASTHQTASREAPPLQTDTRRTGQAGPPRISGRGKRLFDVALSVAILALLSPVLLATTVLLLVRGRKPLLTRGVRLGMHRHLFMLLAFNTVSRWTASLPVLLNILKGDMSFVGPRPLSPGEGELALDVEHPRSRVRPGLVCLWWIRVSASIAYDSEAACDEEYVTNLSLRRDLGILLRGAVVAVTRLLMGDRGAAPILRDQLSLEGVLIDNVSMGDALDAIASLLEDDSSHQVCFVNAQCINVCRHHAEYRRTLDQATYVFADGIGMKLAGKVLGRAIRENVNGTDLFPRLCEVMEKTGRSMYLLGARREVVEGVCEWVARNHPAVRVAGWHDGYFTSAEEEGVIRDIAASGADVLLVAMGVPLQETWISRHLVATGAKVAMGVGGLFDFYSGRIPRAPKWMRELGVEWLYRLYQEPGRMWKRYLVGNGVFVSYALLERSGLRRLSAPGGAPEVGYHAGNAAMVLRAHAYAEYGDTRLAEAVLRRAARQPVVRTATPAVQPPAPRPRPNVATEETTAAAGATR